MKNTIAIKDFPCHMQGFAVNFDGGEMYFSCTDWLIKTDLEGNELKRERVYGGHLGDICYYDGKIYGSLLGQPLPGHQWNDWTSFKIYIFNTELELLDTKNIDYMDKTTVGDNPCGLDGIDGVAIADGHIFIACSIKTGEEYVNQCVLEHTLDFEFVRLCKFEAANTPFGIQNFSYDKELDCFWATTYNPDQPYQTKYTLYRVNKEFGKYAERFAISTPYGFEPLGDGLYYLSEHQGKYPHCDGYARLYRFKDGNFEMV